MGIASFFKRNKREDDKVVSRMPFAEFRAMLKRNGVECGNIEGDRFIGKYQGGLFKFICEERAGIVHICLLHNYRFNCTQKDVAAWVGVECLPYGWSLHTMDLKPGESDKMCSAEICSFVSLTDSDLVSTTICTMVESFDVDRIFHRAFSERLADSCDFDVLRNNADMVNRIAFVRRHQESSERNVFVADGALSTQVGSLLHELGIAIADDDYDTATMQIAVAGEQETAEVSGRGVKEFDLREFLKSHTDVESLTANIAVDKRCIVLGLKKLEGGSAKVVFYRISVASMGELTTDAVLRQQTIAIRLTSDTDDYWEAAYNIEESVAQKLKGHAKMTGLDRLLADLSHTNIKSDIYWASKYYVNNCLPQALYHLKFVYEFLKSNFELCGENGKQDFAYVCYLIGFIYEDMGQHDRSVFYLLTSRHICNNLTVNTELANVICNINSPFALQLIDYLESGLKYMDSDDDEVEEFRRFLTRRKVYALINRRRLDDAEKLINAMLDSGVDADFARNELKYLQDMRADMERSQKKSKSDNIK